MRIKTVVLPQSSQRALRATLLWQINNFFIIMKNENEKKQHATDSISSAATETTPTLSVRGTNDDVFRHFKEKWDVDEVDFATLKKEDDPHECQEEIRALLDEIIKGYTVEVYRDKNNHKRYRFHPSALVLGLKYHGERFGFGCVEGEDTKNTLCIGVKEEWLEEINLLDYTQFIGFVPVIDTRSLSFDIWRVLNHAVRNNE